ncbi:phage tail protein [Escherichia coli]|uniref:phage tail protein n=1 Tax=Escherichia coli TaxID=562 RepID=UPI0024DF0223|nr:phage tail protein [Escherichia coli]
MSQQRKAWDVLSDFCSAMRCMPVWNGQTLTFVRTVRRMWCGRTPTVMWWWMITAWGFATASAP